MRVRRPRLIVLVACAAAAACAGGGAASPHRVQDERLSMGSLTAPDRLDDRRTGGARRVRPVFAEFDRLEGLLSVWREGSDVRGSTPRPGSSRCRCTKTPGGCWRRPRRLSEWTDGTFDITFGALADVWKFDHDQDDRVPTADEIAARLPLVDYRRVRVDDGPGTAVIDAAGRCACTWAASARATRWTGRWRCCARAGLRDFMVQAGGDMYAGGANGEVAVAARHPGSARPGRRAVRRRSI